MHLINLSILHLTNWYLVISYIKLSNSISKSDLLPQVYFGKCLRKFCCSELGTLKILISSFFPPSFSFFLFLRAVIFMTSVFQQIIASVLYGLQLLDLPAVSVCTGVDRGIFWEDPALFQPVLHVHILNSEIEWFSLKVHPCQVSSFHLRRLYSTPFSWVLECAVLFVNGNIELKFFWYFSGTIISNSLPFNAF